MAQLDQLDLELLLEASKVWDPRRACQRLYEHGVTTLTQLAELSVETLVEWRIDTGKLGNVCNRVLPHARRLLVDCSSHDLAAIRQQLLDRALYWACYNDDVVRAQELVALNANVNYHYSDHGQCDRTPLHASAYDGHTEVVAMLLKDSRVDVNAHSEDGWTPLHYSAEKNHKDICNQLLNTKGINVNAVNKDGDTPLHRASYWGLLDVVKALLTCREISLLVRNKDGKTPLDLARGRESRGQSWRDVIKYLQEKLGEEQLTPPDSPSTISENTTPDFSVDDNTAHEVLEQEVDVSTADLMLAGSPGSGKTSVMYLSLNELPPDVRNSTGCVDTPVRAIASGTIYADGTMMRRLETEGMLDMVCGALRHKIENNIRRDYEGNMNTEIHHPVSSTATPTPTQASLEDSTRQDVAAPPKADNTAKLPQVPATTEEEKLKVFAKLMKKVSSVKASPDFLTATLVSTTDSGGQPQFMDACSLLLRSNSLFMITVKLNERLDEKPKFDFFIKGKPISMCSTSLQLTNLQLIESIAKTVSSIQLSTANAGEDGSESRQAKFMLIGTFDDKAHECEGETIADKNCILKEKLKHFKAQLVDNGGDVIFPMNTVANDPDERQKATEQLQRVITNTPGTSVKARIKLRWFGLLMHMLDVAKKGVSILRLDEIIAAGKCLMMFEEETRQAVKCFHDMNLVNHHSTEKLDQLVFVNVKPILDQLTNLIGVAFIDKHMLDEIFKPKVLLAYDQKMLRDYGRFSLSLLESCFSLPSPLTAEVFIDVLEHLSVIARIEKDGQTSFFLPCALNYAAEDVVCKKEKVSVTPWILRLKLRRGAVLVNIPIPKGYLPTLVIRLITSRKFEADFDSHQYRNVMSVRYVDGHVYFIERSHQLEIYYSWDEDSPEECSVIRSEIRKALVEAEEKLHFKPDILTKEDVFICSCNGPHPRHFCAYNRQSQKATCEMSKKQCYLSKQQQYWIVPPSQVPDAAAAPASSSQPSTTTQTPKKPSPHVVDGDTAPSSSQVSSTTPQGAVKTSSPVEVDKNDEPGSSAPPAKKQKTLSQPTYTDHDEPTGNAPPAKKPKTSSQSTDSDYDDGDTAPSSSQVSSTTPQGAVKTPSPVVGIPPLNVSTLNCLKYKSASGKVKRLFVIDDMASRWRKVGLGLSFKPTELDCIESSQQKDPVKCCEQLMSQWLDGFVNDRDSRPKTWPTLLEVMGDARLGELADKIEKIVQ